MFERTPQRKEGSAGTGHGQPAAGDRTSEGIREFSAPTVSEAIDLACTELGIGREGLDYEIRDSGLLNMLGFDSEAATIAVRSFSARKEAGPTPSDSVSKQRPITKDLASIDLDPRVIEEAAHRLDMSWSLVRQRYRDGQLLYDPNRHKLVEAPGMRASTKEHRGSGSTAVALGRVPQGYWVETDKMVLSLKRGEKHLLWTIVERLEPVVHAVVRKVQESNHPIGLEEGDLLQVGRLEITGLIGSYDPRSKTKIHPYMRQWLYHRILRVVDELLPVRVPANMAPDSHLAPRAAFFRSQDAYEQLEELPEDAFVGGEEDFEEVLREDLFRRVVRSAPLSGRQRYVLEHRYGLDNKEEKTLEQVGADLGLTRERVRQLQQEAIKTIKGHVYQSFGLNTGLDLSSGRWRKPKAFPAVVRGDFSLGESPQAQPSISAVQEWAGHTMPYKKQHVDRTAAKLVHTSHTQPADPVRIPSGSAGRAGGRVPDLANRLIDEKGVVAVSEIVNRSATSRASEASIIGKLRKMGLTEVTPGHWARPLRASVYQEVVRCVASNGLMAVESLLTHLRYNPNVRSDELPPLAVFRAFLQNHPNFRVDKVGTVHLTRPPASVLGKRI